MPREVTKNFIRRRLLARSKCAKDSFRTVKRGATRITVCCPRGKWRGSHCTVGMRAQSILRRRRKRR